MVTQTAPADQSQTVTATAACQTAAWDCQMHTYLGAPDSVAANLATVPDSLVERRVYMLMVQGDDRAEAHLFERFAFEDDEGTIATWSDHKLGDMVTRLTEVLIGNGGAHCPGEQVKASLATDHEFSVGVPTAAPKTAAEAFAPVIASFSSDKFVQATVMALC